MTLRRAGIGLVCLVPLGLALFARDVALEADAAAQAQSKQQSQNRGPGALVKMEMSSQVAVLLDEFPAGALRETAAREALTAPASAWTERAARQVKLMSYRLVFRGGFYGGTKGPLPLPSQTVWKITAIGKPKRTTIEGHDVVALRYTFKTFLVSDADSPGVVEPALAEERGTWTEPMVLPADPELLLERTGFACLDEFEFPPNSVNEQNVSYYYDHTCGVETPDTSACHVTEFPALSCQAALSSRIGSIATDLKFTRLDYDSEIADKFRVGTITNHTGADLAVVTDYLVDERSIVYKYFDAASCDVAEGTVASSGWRRLLTFSATVQNNGVIPIHIGDPRDPSNPYAQSHVFEFSPCHQHYHFSHYGTFQYGTVPGRKLAFCLEDTNRMHNDETTPLSAVHQSCEYQGIGAGWGDEYNFGLPGQWIDITGVDTSRTKNLTFQTNPDQFMCEGIPLDARNRPIADPVADLARTAFDPTSFRGEFGDIVSRVRCRFPSPWSANNIGSVPVAPATGSFVTQPCAHGEVGPNRDCGFSDHPQPLHACTAGQTVTLTCAANGPAAVLRICEASDKLGALGCTNRESFNALVSGRSTTVSFSCPAVRDSTGGAGGYSVLEAPVLPSQGSAGITCKGW